LVSGSLKGEIGYQRLLTSVWDLLCRYGREDDIYTDHGVIGSNLLLATSSVGYQEYISQ